MKKISICLLMCVWTIAVTIASQFIIGYPLIWLFGASFLVSAVGEAIYSALVYILALFLIIFVPWKIFKKWKTNPEEMGIRGLPTWTDIGLAPIGFIVSLILASVFLAIFSLFPWFNAEEAQDVGFHFLDGGLDRAVAFITLVIVAPIAEELIFRGWLYGKLRAKLNMPLAIFLVSLAFGIVHGQWNVGVNVFALSIVLCGLREITGTIYSGILVHMIKNGIAFFLLYIIGIM